MNSVDYSRRQVLKGSAAAMAVGAIGSLGALYTRQALAAAGDPTRLSPIPSPYGELAPVADQSTGLPLLQLPPGFSYQSFSWSGDAMADGRFLLCGQLQPGRCERDAGQPAADPHRRISCRSRPINCGQKRSSAWT